VRLRALFFLYYYSPASVLPSFTTSYGSLETRPQDFYTNTKSEDVWLTGLLRSYMMAVVRNEFNS
jgi:hypothetical protein